jgi:hypothetical protein
MTTLTKRWTSIGKHSSARSCVTTAENSDQSVAMTTHKLSRARFKMIPYLVFGTNQPNTS